MSKWAIHPLVRLFHMRRMTEHEGMAWLQDFGHISDNAVRASDVAACDVAAVTAKFKARWEVPARKQKAI